MQSLPFERVREIQSILTQVSVEDLVLVFSQAEGHEYLLVYNTDEGLPPMADQAWQTRRLRDLQPGDYTRFDGPLAGLAELDLLLADIPTHGPDFRALEYLLPQEKEVRDQLQRTRYGLARTLLEHLEGLPEGERRALEYRLCAKVIRLALPSILAGHSKENLVAVLPPADLNGWLDKPSELRLIYCTPSQTNDLDWLQKATIDEEKQWMVGLEEIGLFRPGLGRDNPRFTELRLVLRQMEAGGTLRDTVRQLARHCWALSEESKDEKQSEEFRSMAYALAAEAWLGEEDPAELIALFPCQNFVRFVGQGDALRIYRTPAQAAASGSALPGPRISVDQLIENGFSKVGYATPPISFPVLEPALKRLGGRNMLNLGPILYKAGRATELARTWWLLSRDLLRSENPAWRAIGAEPAAITDLALRATLIYGLSDPWRWRQGRQQIFLSQCYAHLSECLLHQQNLASEDELKEYYRGLRAWYDCYTASDQVQNLSLMLRTLKTFLDASQFRHNCVDEREIASRLIEVGKNLTFGPRETGVPTQGGEQEGPKAFEVASYLRNVSDSQFKLAAPSQPFEERLQTYYALHHRWRRLQDMSSHERPSAEALDRLLAEYRRQLRVVYGPAHEIAILRSVYRQDTERIERLRQAIDIGPIIKIDLRNPWVTLGCREQLSFNVENVGVGTAYQVELDLLPSRNFELHPEPVSWHFETLSPGHPQRLTCEMRATEPSLALRLNCRFRDHQGEAYDTQETVPLEVRQPDQREIGHLSNPYQAGPPVFGRGRFFGRDRELVRILTRLMSGITQPMLLRAPRRVGKSSLLKHLDWTLKHRQELRRLGFSEEQIIQLRPVRPVMTNLQEPTPSLIHYVVDFFQAIFQQTCDALGVEYDSQRLERDFERSPTRAFIRHVDRLFREHPDQRPVIMLDEWDELYRPEYEELDRNLRFLMEEEQRINWLVSSTWALSAESGRYGSPFYNQSYPIELGALGWEAAVELVTAPSHKLGVEWRSEAVVALLEQSGRRPYLAQWLCAQVIDQLRTNLVDLEVVTAAVNTLSKQTPASSMHFGFLRTEKNGNEKNKDSVRWMGRLILWALDRVYPQPLSRLEIRQHIQQEFQRHSLQLPDAKSIAWAFEDQMTMLEKIFDVVTEVGAQRYQFSIPLVRVWFHRHIAQQEDLIQQAHQGLLEDLQEVEDHGG